MEQFVEKAKKILIATGINADLDQIAAAITLAKILKFSGKKVNLLLDINPFSNQVLDIFPTGDIKTIQKANAESFVVSINKDNAQVKDVKWKEEKGKIEIFITTEQGNLEQKGLSIKPNYSLFDAIIVIGIKELNELGEFYKKNPKAFPVNKIVQVGGSDLKIGAYRHQADCNIACIQIVEFLEKLKLEITSEYASDLLAGILWKTDGLKDGTKGELINDSLKKLFDKRPNIETASKKAFRNLKIEETRLINLITKNLVQQEGGIVHSIISAKESKGINFANIISNRWFVIDLIKGNDLGVIIIETSTTRSKAYIKAQSTRYNLLDSFKGHKAKGDSSNIILDFEKSPKEALEEILVTLKVKPKTKKQREDAPEENNAVGFDPLAPAKEMPKALDVSQKENEKSGYNPPPPINPLPPTQ